MLFSPTGPRLKMLKARLFLLLLLTLDAPAAETVVISSAEWARPRSGETLARMPGLVQLARRLVDARTGHIRIRHPGGEEGVVWAEELRGWLVALGIASTQIELVPGTSRPGAVELELKTTPGWNP